MITGVAIKDKNGTVWTLPKPYRHCDVVSFMQSKNTSTTQSTEGFLDDKGKFLDRKAAFFVALSNNQLLPPYNPINPSERRWDLEIDKTPRQLFSEDLW